MFDTYVIYCYVFVPIYIVGAAGHLCGLLFTWSRDNSFPLTVKIWISAIDICAVVNLIYWGIYQSLNLASVVRWTEKLLPYIPPIIIHSATESIYELYPVITLGLACEKVIAVTWPMKLERWTGVILTFLYFLVFEVVWNTVGDGAANPRVAMVYCL